MNDDNCANPLLLGWIKEILDQARERNSKGITVCVYLMKQILIQNKPANIHRGTKRRTSR